MNKVFSLIICGYNEEKNLDRCIKSCLNLKYPQSKYEIIYVDNNSKDMSLEVAKKYPIKIFTEKKQGLSESRNCGIKNSLGEILVFLDADTRLDENYLKEHINTFSNPCVAVGGGKVLPLVETWISNYLGVSLFDRYPRYLKTRYIKTYPGCNLTIRKKILDRFGYFKEGLVTAEGITRFAEDKEICSRIRSNGFKILYNPKSIIYHENTYKFSRLFKIWIKGSKGRLNAINSGASDPFSILFKYNIPFILLAILVISMFTFWKVGMIMIFILLSISLYLSIVTYWNTGLAAQSFLIKPVMDILAVFVIQASVNLYKYGKLK